MMELIMPRPPGPKGTLLKGVLEPFREDPLSRLGEWTKTYGDLVYFRLGAFDFYHLNHPEYIYEVLVEQARKFNKTWLVKRVMGSILGNGLLVSDGDFHMRQRRLVQPSFHHQRIKDYAEVMTRYTTELLDDWQPGQSINVAAEMAKVTLRIVAKTLLDVETAHLASRVVKAVDVMQDFFNKQANSIAPGILHLLPTVENIRQRLTIQWCFRVFDQMIRERRAEGVDKGDLLSMLLMAVDEDDQGRMTDREVRDEVSTMFFAGHETTATALTWTWYLLSQNPEVETKLHAELDSVLGGRLPTMQDFPQLPYTQMVFKEALRLYPPAWLLSRQAIEDVTIGGYPIRASPREIVLIIPYIMHRHPAFFPEPERFLPERFIDEKKIPRCAYFPFGSGTRICAGQAFAMMEAVTIIATIAQRYRLSLAPGRTVVPEPYITLRPKGGMWMRPTLRTSATRLTGS